MDDPLINLEHAKKYVKFIPKARKYYLEGMGHDLPDKYIKSITNEIIKIISVPKINKQTKYENKKPN